MFSRRQVCFGWRVVESLHTFLVWRVLTDLTLTAGGRLPLLSATHHYCTSESDRGGQKSLYRVEQRNSQRREQCLSLPLVFSEISLLFDVTRSSLLGAQEHYVHVVLLQTSFNFFLLLFYFNLFFTVERSLLLLLILMSIKKQILLCQCSKSLVLIF